MNRLGINDDPEMDDTDVPETPVNTGIDNSIGVTTYEHAGIQPVSNDLHTLPAIQQGEERIQRERIVIRDDYDQFRETEVFNVDGEKFDTYHKAVDYLHTIISSPETDEQKVSEIFHMIQENVTQILYRMPRNTSELLATNTIGMFLYNKVNENIIDKFWFSRSMDTFDYILSLKKGDSIISWNMSMDLLNLQYRRVL